MRLSVWATNVHLSRLCLRPSNQPRLGSSHNVCSKATGNLGSNNGDERKEGQLPLSLATIFYGLLQHQPHNPTSGQHCLSPFQRFGISSHHIVHLVPRYPCSKRQCGLCYQVTITEHLVGMAFFTTRRLRRNF